MIDEGRGWEEADSGAEIVARAIELGGNVARSPAPTPRAIERYVDVAQPAVRHLRTTAEFSRAIEIGSSALAACERAFGPDHLRTLSLRKDLAGAYESDGDLDRAIVLYEQTLADSERVLGPDQPKTLTSRNNLAGAYQLAGELTRAIPLFERALSDSERVLGPDHPSTRIFRSNLGRARA